jgi:8-amino-7-oxononanoate synthase
MLDFTSALYLGLRHASASLPPWAQLTGGVPYALGTPPLARTVAARLATLVGAEHATLARSTLHAFWDLFVTLADEDTAIHVETSAYPIARWGVERAAGRGVPARAFARHDPDDLRRRLATTGRSRRRPIVVTDGVCPGCGGLAPLGRYLEIAREFGGTLVVDDTQALGILGHSPGLLTPYGAGGGGSLRRHGLGGADVLLVASLAKGLGVPMTVLAGSAASITRFEHTSETRVHCSPPSSADLSAATRALEINRSAGDRLRLRLARLVRRFRHGLRRLGIQMARGLFPVQRLALPASVDVPALHGRLLSMGVRTVLQRPVCRPAPSLAFLITARHSPAAIDRALHAIGLALGMDQARRRPLAHALAMPGS